MLLFISCLLLFQLCVGEIIDVCPFSGVSFHLPGDEIDERFVICRQTVKSAS